MLHCGSYLAIILVIGSLTLPVCHCCPNKIKEVGKSIGSTIGGKFRSLRKSKKAVDGDLPSVSIKNPKCQNPFIPCDDPSILGAAASLAMPAAVKAANPHRLSTKAKIALGVGGGAAVLGVTGAVLTSGDSKDRPKKLPGSKQPGELSDAGGVDQSRGSDDDERSSPEPAPAPAEKPAEPEVEESNEEE